MDKKKPLTLAESIKGLVVTSVRIARRANHAALEVKMLLEVNKQLQEEIAKLKAEQDRLTKQNAALVEELKWYGNKDTHEIKRRVLGDFAPITLDKGQRARTLLAQISTEEEREPT